jgi:hypothetical protein
MDQGYMRRAMTLPGLRSLAALGAAMLIFLPANGLGDVPCSGHKLLPKPRPEASCRNFVPQIYVSPDQALRASVLPSDVSLYATPDMESRVVIRTSKGDTLTSKDYSSPRYKWILRLQREMVAGLAVLCLSA